MSKSVSIIIESVNELVPIKSVTKFVFKLDLKPISQFNA